MWLRMRVRGWMIWLGVSRGTNWPDYQAQHIIPAEMASHPVLQKIGIDLDDASNKRFATTSRSRCNR